MDINREEADAAASDWTTDGRVEIAFLGRSNVGKSSLINSLLMRKGLARTSNTPWLSKLCINVVIHHEKCWARHTRFRQARE